MDSGQPEKIDRYQILKKVNEGVSGIIYFVEFENQKYALKLLKNSNEDSLKRFRKESSSLARLNHENLIKLFDFGEFENTAYLVTEFLEGQSIEQKLEVSGMIDQEAAVHIIQSVAKALEELHKKNLLHRDIKPANIFLTQTNKVVLIDLGLVDDVNEIRSETAVVGTPLFSSPEQNRVLKKDIDFRSELYSVGATLFTILTGRPPFIGTLTEILQLHASRIAPDVREVNPVIRPSLAAIVAKCLKKDPDDRYQSATGLIYDLNRLGEIDEAILSGLNPKLDQKGGSKKSTQTVYVPRKNENDQLNKIWLTIAANKPAFANITGSSGLGKSRFCFEFLANLSEPKLLILNSKCKLLGKEIPFGAIREAFDNLIEATLNLPEKEKEEQLRLLKLAAMGLEKYLLRLSKRFRKIFLSDNSNLIDDNVIDSESETFSSKILDFLFQLCDSNFKVVLFIDDLQWLDTTSLLLLKKIFAAQRDVPLLLLGTTRNEDQYSSDIKVLEETLSHATQEKIVLNKLTPLQLSTLAGNFLGASNLLPDITNIIEQKSSGNPLIAIEYLRVGIELGFLSYRSGNWQLDEKRLKFVNLSDNVYDIILKRLEICTKEAHEFLQYCALYGNAFSLNELITAAEINLQAGESVVFECQKLGLLEKEGLVKWKLIHDKIGESILLKMSSEETKKKAAKLAKFLFLKIEKSTDDIFSAARLFSLSHNDQNNSQAIDAHIDAANLAFSNYAYQQAYFFYKWADFNLKKSKDGLTRRLETADNLAISASLQQDAELAIECVDLSLRFKTSIAEQAHSMALKVLILNHQSQFTDSWEYFKKISSTLGNPYPIHLQWKLLNIVWLWFTSIILQFIPLKLSNDIIFRTKNIKLEKISNLLTEAFYISETLNRPLDMWNTALRLLILGQLAGSREVQGLGHAYVGFCYGICGIKSLFKRSLKLSSHFLLGSQSTSIIAKSEVRQMLGGYWCGEINNFLTESKKKNEFFYKYLSPTDYSRFRLVEASIFALSGQNHNASEIYIDLLQQHDNKLVLIPKHTRIIYLNMLWSNLSILGNVQESQKIRKLALYAHNELKFNPSVTISTIYGELMVGWTSPTLEGRVDEIVDIFKMRRMINFASPLIVSMQWFMGFALNRRLKQSNSKEEFFSVNSDLNRLLRAHFSTNYFPSFRAFYYCLNGCYQANIGNIQSAERNFTKAETLANKFNSLFVLFRIQLERARICLKSGHLELMKLHLAAALDLSIRQQWKDMTYNLQMEFRDFISPPHSIDNTQINKTHIGRFSPNSTIMQTQMGSSVQKSSNTTQMGGSTDNIAPENLRFVNAMFNVSNAFVTSINLTQQAEAILNELIKLFGAERGFIFEANQQSRELKVLTGKNSEGQELKNLRGFSETVVNKVYKDQIPLIIAGTDEAEAIGADSAVLYNLRSIIAAPLSIKGRALGIVYLDSTLVKGLFTQSDVSLFSNLASNISVAFELSRMTQVELEKANLRRELDIQSAIASESKKVKILVDNMQQALFSVSEIGEVIEPVSRFSENVFGSNIAGKNVYEVLFRDLQSQKMDSIKSTFSAAFGEDQLQWDLIEDNLPRKLQLKNVDSSSEVFDRTLKIQPSPIWDKNDKLENILFVVEDITGFERLENEVIEAKSQATLLSEILDSNRDELRDFFSNVKSVLEHYTIKPQELTNDSLNKLIRDLHTIKGNARLFKLKTLSEQIHNTESEIGQVRNSQAHIREIELKVISEMLKIEENLKKYFALFRRIYSEKDNLVSGTPHSLFAIFQLNNIIKSLESVLSTKEIMKLNLGVQRLSFKSLATSTSRFIPMVNDLAEQLNKKANLTIEGDALVEESKETEIQDVLLHMIRNSLDHGLESAEERIAQGKSEVGKIQIELIDQIDFIEIKVSDDGRGIDGEKISKTALSRGLITFDQEQHLSLKEKTELIFLPNLSTKEVASELSGRGIGMEIVKKNIEQMGGQIDFDTKLQHGSTFRIKLKTLP